MTHLSDKPKLANTNQRSVVSAGGRYTFYTVLAIAALVLLCINPGYTSGEHQLNILLACAMAISPLVLLIPATRIFLPRIDIPLIGVCLLVLCLPHIFYPETVRLSTLLFTCACCFYFMMTARLLMVSHLSAETLSKTIRYTIYAFAVVLLLQQLCVLLGITPVFSNSHYYGGWLYGKDWRWKLNSLTAEASHTSYTLGILMLYYTAIYCRKHKSLNLWGCIRKDPVVWIAFLWVLFSSDNASAYVFAPLCFLPFISRRTIAPAIGIASTVVILLMIATPVARNREFMRAQRAVFATLALKDTAAIVEADNSISQRIVPSIQGARRIVKFDKATIIGHGVDADMRDIPKRAINTHEPPSAGMFKMWYNYGMPAALLLWLGTIPAIIVRREWYTYIVAAIAFVVSAEHNLQLFWMTVAFGMAFKHNVCGTPYKSLTLNLFKQRK